ncbi:pyridoxamine 5'-phosphate oxidase family protein [bacterium]|nr:pyridoxamine 5'-phosphate oxidase family protein [bacterium]
MVKRCSQHDMMNKIEELIEVSRSGVLATADKSGRPHVRWMTPVTLKGRAGVLFAVTSPQFAKVMELKAQPRVQWMIQHPSLNEVVTISGRVNVIDNPALKTEVMDALGARLLVFWKLNRRSQWVVLETVIEEATLFMTMKGEKKTVTFA